MTTRFLLTAISTALFDGERTLNTLHEAIAEDATDLFWNGFDVTRPHSLAKGCPRCAFLALGWKWNAAALDLRSWKRRLGLFEKGWV